MGNFNTGNAIPSISEEDMYDNSMALDQAMNSTESTWRDRFGVEKPTIDAALKSAGFMPAGFDFVTGGTLQPGDRNKTVYNPAPNGDNNWYRWNGVFPKEIAANSQPNPKGENSWVPVNLDTKLREDLASNKGPEFIGFGAGTVSEALLNDSLTPDIMGAKGDGITSDQQAVINALTLAGNTLNTTQGAKYLVESITNILGKQIFGKGKIVKSAPGGLESQNTYADAYQRITGLEYMSHWYSEITNQLKTPTKKLKIGFSGDSTTKGDGITDPVFKINDLVKFGIGKTGCSGSYGVECINLGHSGGHTGQWADSFVNNDKTLGLDVYVVRWGINDPGYLKSGAQPPLDAGQNYPNRRDVTDFAVSLREGLGRFRETNPISKASIILMMPNSTYDIPNGRDALWYEQLRDVYVQAARDFKCAFIDTYAIMQDSKHLANVLMDDPMPTSGRGIHPNDAMNTIISGYIVDVLIPNGLRNSYSNVSNLNVAGVELLVSFNEPPSSFKSGMVTIYRVVRETGGWPMDGHILTFFTADLTVLQFHFGYKDQDRGKLKVRFGRAGILADEPEGWSNFFDLTGGSSPQFLKTDVIPSTGFSVPQNSKMRASAEGSFRTLEGYITTVTPGILNKNALIGTMNTQFVPGYEACYCTATLWNGTDFEQVPAVITSGVTAGEIRLLKTSTLAVQRIYITASWTGQR